MVRITEELLRRRAWPAGETGLASVRELALHSLGIERIEYIGSRCRGVKLLMLQNNVIARLENLGRLKVGRRRSGFWSSWSLGGEGANATHYSPCRISST